ncbi:MAG: hypothetical protein COA97_10985 [Flavobacteriales bacterium]|nr:MAG: hypothetical protein COA97_10985 [Flavobacteriales bacterium]
MFFERIILIVEYQYFSIVLSFQHSTLNNFNIYYFFKNDDTELDTVFINLTKTFKEAHENLNVLEKNVGRNLKGARNKLKFYENNAKKTRRKYKYYSKYIEPSLVKIFVGKGAGLYKKCWKHLANPVKYHYINIYVALGLAALIVIVMLFLSLGFWAFLVILFFIGMMLRLYNFIVKANFLFFYILLDLILIVFKQDRGKLMKNVGLLELMTSGWFGGRSYGGYVIGAVGVAAYSGFGSGGGGFGGFGGGSFGGGGAGGSW